MSLARVGRIVEGGREACLQIIKRQKLSRQLLSVSKLARETIEWLTRSKATESKAVVLPDVDEYVVAGGWRGISGDESRLASDASARRLCGTHAVRSRRRNRQCFSR